MTTTPVALTELRQAVTNGVKPGWRVFGALLLAAPWLPATMIVTTATVTIGAPGRSDWGTIASGAVLGIILWLLLAALLAPTVDAASRNTTQFNSIQRRLTELETRLDGLQNAQAPSAKEARAAFDAAKELLTDPNPAAWVLASGYNEVWKRLHQVTQALSLVETDDRVLIAAKRVRLRLTESTVDTKDKLLVDLDEALKSGAVDAKLRAAVLNASKAVDEYRDGRWDDIVGLKEDYRFHTAVVGGVAYLGLVVVLAQGIPATAVFAVTAYLIVGAFVGIITRAEGRAEGNASIEDFGLDRTRVGLAILVSAVVAVVSVGLIAFLATASITTLVQPPFTEATSAPTAGVAPTPGASASVASAAVDFATPYDLARYPGGLLIAAIFGLTPRLLLSSLTAQAERLKTQLQSTEVTDVKK